jgi:hypothetical protein
MAILGAIMIFPSFSTDKTLLERIQALECLASQYRKTTGTNISDDILQTILVRALPRPLQKHMQFGTSNSTTYQAVQHRVVAYEKVSSSWPGGRMFVERGAGPVATIPSYASAGKSGPGSMEIDLVQQSAGEGAKGKGSYDRNKSQGKGNGKSKELLYFV